MEAWKQKEKKLKKLDQLKERRDKLAKLLQEEREQYKVMNHSHFQNRVDYFLLKQ